MKTCCKCKIEKSEAQFYKQKNRKDGLSPECKDCEKIRKNKYYLENLEYVRKLKREGAERRKEKRHEYEKKKYYQDLEISRQKGRTKYWLNRGKIRKTQNAKNKSTLAREKANIRQKKWREERKEIYNAFQRAYRSKNALKIHAVMRVNDALRYDKLVKPNICEVCSKEKELQAHHDDYNKPLEVRWLCRLCHCHIHGKLLDVPS